MDATLAIAVLYHYLDHWVEIKTGPEMFPDQRYDWYSYIEEALGPLVGRSYRVKKKMYRRLVEKDLSTHALGLEESGDTASWYEP